jgi:hypothetical protein
MAGARSGRVSAMVTLCALACVAGLRWPLPLRAAPESWMFPLRVHLASADDSLAAERWLAAQVSETNRLYAPLGVSFVVNERVALDDAYVRIETPDEALGLTWLLDPAQIDVFVVESLAALDTSTGTALGICRPPPESPLVAVVVGADDPVLAHELGHYFGREHTNAAGNLMGTYTASGPYRLDAAQGAQIVEHARWFARVGEPEALTAPPPAR